MWSQLLVSLVTTPLIVDNYFLCLFISSHECINKSLSQTPECPVCKTNLTHDGGFAPNFSCKFQFQLQLTLIYICNFKSLTWMYTLFYCFLVNDVVAKIKSQERHDSMTVSYGLLIVL